MGNWRWLLAAIPILLILRIAGFVGNFWTGLGVVALLAFVVLLENFPTTFRRYIWIVFAGWVILFLGLPPLWNAFLVNRPLTREALEEQHRAMDLLSSELNRPTALIAKESIAGYCRALEEIRGEQLKERLRVSLELQRGAPYGPYGESVEGTQRMMGTLLRQIEKDREECKQLLTTSLYQLDQQRPMKWLWILGIVGVILLMILAFRTRGFWVLAFLVAVLAITAVFLLGGRDALSWPAISKSSVAFQSLMAMVMGGVIIGLSFLRFPGRGLVTLIGVGVLVSGLTSLLFWPQIQELQGIQRAQAGTVPRPVSVATPYESLIQQASQRHGVPADLIRAVIRVESDFNPNAKSPEGALGLMQVLPATAKRYGIEGDLFDPEQNIEAGTRYLADLLKGYGGDTELALAAYNIGEDRVEELAKLRGPSFAAIASDLPAETQNFVPQVLQARGEVPMVARAVAEEFSLNAGEEESTVLVGPGTFHRIHATDQQGKPVEWIALSKLSDGSYREYRMRPVHSWRGGEPEGLLRVKGVTDGTILRFEKVQ
mgnify:CR=1 FL=1